MTNTQGNYWKLISMDRTKYRLRGSLLFSCQDQDSVFCFSLQNIVVRDAFFCLCSSISTALPAHVCTAPETNIRWHKQESPMITAMRHVYNFGYSATDFLRKCRELKCLHLFPTLPNFILDLHTNLKDFLMWN